MNAAHRTTIRVRYGETDQMGFAYHANYIAWFEVGRTELMRAHGICYAEMERAGIALAVAEACARYRKPAFYDDVLVIETRLHEASGVRLRFDYRVLRTPAAPSATEEVVCEGYTILASIGRARRPTRLPSPWRERVAALLQA